MRAIAGRPEVLLVHRPRYRDWTFPKGKCSSGEVELPETSYLDDRGRPKRVRWWRMRVEGGELAFLHEVDAAEWLGAEEAARRLTYDRDQGLLEAALRLAPPAVDG